jgi:hypothetical protein
MHLPLIDGAQTRRHPASLTPRRDRPMWTDKPCSRRVFGELSASRSVVHIGHGRILASWPSPPCRCWARPCCAARACAPGAVSSPPPTLWRQQRQTRRDSGTLSYRDGRRGQCRRSRGLTPRVHTTHLRRLIVKRGRRGRGSDGPTRDGHRGSSDLGPGFERVPNDCRSRAGASIKGECTRKRDRTTCVCP